MEPIPETLAALQDLTRHGDTTLAAELMRLGREVERIVPQIVGLSLAVADEGLTFTLTASAATAAELDGVQYLSGGPCDETARTGEPHEFRLDDAADEECWRVFARATAAAGVAATLSLPILLDGAVVAGVNLYASTPDAFEGKRDALARVCGASARAATTNADLGFTTRFTAAETPARIRDDRVVDQAVGLVMSQLGLDLDAATARLSAAAQRAGISDAQLARALLDLGGHDPS